MIVMHFLRPAAPESSATRLDLVTPSTADTYSFAVSPNGRQLAFVATADGTSQLWVRFFDSGDTRPLAGTEGASYPFWKPDGSAIGFFANGKLKRVGLAAGELPQTLTNAPGGRGGTWNQDDVIVFAPEPISGLMRIDGRSRTPVVLTHLGQGESSHRWPQFLPDGRHFLFLSTQGLPSTRGVFLGSLDGRDPTRRLLSGDIAAVYAPPDYLLRVIDGVLVAYPFNPESGVVSQEWVTLAQPAGTDDGTMRSALSVSPTALAYRAGGPARRQLVWLDRSGSMTGTVGPSDEHVLSNPELAPGGRRIAVNRTVQGNYDIYINELADGSQHRFTFDPALEWGGVWSPNGSHIVFSSNRKERYELFEKEASGVRDEQPLVLTPQDQDKVACDWSFDGRFLLYASRDPTMGSDLWAWSLGDNKSFPVVRTSADEREGQFSPDGRWVAYVSNASEIDEVYVQSFPVPGAKQQVSRNGGVDPRWGPKGRELFYVAPDGKLMAVSFHVNADGAPKLGVPVGLFSTRLATGANITVGFLQRPQYAVAADGHFLMNVTADDNVVSPISIVLNWVKALKK
jgi:Tol biopolymer transport system component